ncbi:MAG TPA: XdhC family protein, partial [Candidatus Acidoferrales bacterium]|nr:XdhC family protein [Candidatus Acidoferrales bacterium]
MDIYEELIKLRRQGRKAALATIVHTQGSIPSFQASKMLVRDDGSIFGTVGGGCVEAEVRKHAMQLMRSGEARLMEFKLDHDYGWDDGLICGGSMDVYIQTLDASSAARFESIRAAIAA